METFQVTQPFKMTSQQMSEYWNDRIPVLFRLLLYGMLGFTTEVIFTGIWYFLDSHYNYGWTLVGCTSLWSFPIYALSIFAIEKMCLFLHAKLPLAARGLIYLSWIYLSEFISGFILRQFGACPWDYHGYTTFHFKGLIAFDYAPLWYIGTLLLETTFIKYTLTLQHTELKSI